MIDGKIYPKQIAAQSGLSLATIDRALHHQGQVHPQTLHRIHGALADLELLQSPGSPRGRTIYFDVIMHTERFSELVREALSSQLASFNPFAFSSASTVTRTSASEEMNALLKMRAQQPRRDFKGHELPSLVSTIDALLKRRVPVVTIVTDIPSSAVCATSAWIMLMRAKPRHFDIKVAGRRQHSNRRRHRQQ